MHENVGHLGIFVSGDIARKEYREFASNIDLIDVLPPGLYEVVMTAKTPDAASPELINGDWIVRFERRSLEDIRAIVRPSLENERRFAAVRRVSETNLGLYRTFLQPFVKAAASPQLIGWAEKLDPSEMVFQFFSPHNPLMGHIRRCADLVREQRRHVGEDNPYMQWQEAASTAIIATLEGWKELRDIAAEQTFRMVY